MAKDKLERGISVLIDDSGGSPQELGGDLVPGSLNGLGFTAGEIDMTGATENLNYLADKKDVNLTMQFHMNDDSPSGATTVLNGIVGGAAVTVTIAVGQGGATPTTGDPEFEGEFVCLAADVQSSGGRLVHNAVFRPSGGVNAAWGTKT